MIVTKRLRTKTPLLATHGTKGRKVRDIDHVIAAFSKHYDTAFQITTEVEVDHIKSHELHPSSFPYCGLRHAYERLRYGDPTTGTWNMASDYFTRVGTTVHSVMQDWVTKVRHRHETKLASDFLGDWSCLNEKCGYKRYNKQYKPCPRCGSDMLYDELSVSYGKHIVGHTDGVFLVGSKNNAYLMDYKTTSSYAVQTHKTTGKKFPYNYNVSQIRSYCALVQKKYKVNIKGWLLVYCSRDNPMGSYVVVGDSFSAKDHQLELERMATYDRHFALARYFKSIADIRTLAKEKPCKSYDWYIANQHNEYSGCPLAESKLCFSPSLPKTLIKLFDKNGSEVIKNTKRLPIKDTK